MQEKYQEKPHWSNYAENKIRICEIYGLDPRKCSVHHIITREDCLTNPLFANFDLNQLSNLYPFSIDNLLPHTDPLDHELLHQKIYGITISQDNIPTLNPRKESQYWKNQLSSALEEYQSPSFEYEVELEEP